MEKGLQTRILDLLEYGGLKVTASADGALVSDAGSELRIRFSHVEQGYDADLYNLYLDKCGPKKIQTIKTVRTFSNLRSETLGLKEAKDLVDMTSSTRPQPQLVIVNGDYVLTMKTRDELLEDGNSVTMVCTTPISEEHVAEVVSSLEEIQVELTEGEK